MNMRSRKFPLSQLGVLRPPMPWHRPKIRGAGDELVICIHGLWRSKWAMEPLAKSLARDGYSTYNLPYPSFKETLSEMSDRLATVIDTVGDQYRKVHLVTHSLGGVIARRYFSEHKPSNCGRVLMIAPPLKGSRIVDWLGESPLRKALGPAGDFLSTQMMEYESQRVDVEAGVIMGDVTKIPFLHHVIGEESDGIVRVESGRVDGLKAFKVVHADHTFITSDPEVMSLASEFLKSGEL